MKNENGQEKSAILKGQTLVNIYDYSISTFSKDSVTIKNGVITLKANGGWVTVNNKLPMLKPKTNYTVFVNILSNTLTYSSSTNNYALQIEVDRGNTGFNSGYQIPKDSVGIFKKLLTTKESFSTTQLSDVRIPSSANGGEIKFTYMIIEGDHTQEDIPYFEGMQSVQAPGVTMTNEDNTKTITLSTPSDLELRKVGEVQDELNVMTGEVVERIGEMVLDGSENWQEYTTNTTNTYCGVIRDDTISNYKGTIYLNDKLAQLSDSDIDSEGIRINSGKRIFVRLNRNKGVTDLATFKQYLSQNPITIQYELATPTAKTVDLSVVNQDGNETKLRTFDDTTHVLLNSEGVPIQKASLTVKTKIPSASSTSLLMDELSTNQQQLESTVDEQSNNVDATMIATTEIYEETL